jgi:hypothetical protein
MEFQAEPDDQGGSNENAQEIDNRVDALLGDQGIGDPPAAEPPAADAVTPSVPASGGDAIDTDGYSPHALLALSYQKVEKLIPEDVQVPKDLTADGLADFLAQAKAGKSEEDAKAWEAARIESIKAQLEQQGITKKDFELLAHLKAGGSPVAVSRYEELNRWATEPAEDNDEKFETIRFAAELNGQKKEYVDAYIAQNLISQNEIDEAFAASQKLISEHAERELEADRERMRIEQERRVEDWQQFENAVKGTVTKGFKSITISKPEQQELIDFMTKRSVPIDVIENGQKVRKMITPYQEFGRKLQKDMEENVAFAYHAMKGANGMINAATKAARDSFVDASIEALKNRSTSAAAPTSSGDVDGEILMQVGFG